MAGIIRLWFSFFFLLAGIYAAIPLPWWTAILYLGAPSPAGLAALLRVFGPLLYPIGISVWHWASAVLWGISFLLFAVVYASILTRPRVDAKPG